MDIGPGIEIGPGITCEAEVVQPTGQQAFTTAGTFTWTVKKNKFRQ